MVHLTSANGRYIKISDSHNFLGEEKRRCFVVKGETARAHAALLLFVSEVIFERNTLESASGGRKNGN